MNYMKQYAQLTQRYLKEVKGQDLTIEQILERPHWKQVWYHFLALEYFEGYEIKMTMEECKKIYGE